MTIYTRVGKVIGYGSYCNVYKAICEPPSAVIAYKKSRISLRIQRTMLRHEARVMQLLQGHPAIPRLVGYRRGTHFEYIGMELLGMEVKAMVQAESALRPGTVARVGEQMLAALEHLYHHQIIHRDIKAGNILLCAADPSRVCLIDFGLARYLGVDMKTAPKKLFEENKTIFGTLSWCSQHGHEGFELRPTDDLESLAYTLFFLLLGGVPWRFTFSRYCLVRAMKMVHESKREFTSSLPLSSTPFEFSALLQCARAPVDDWAASLAVQRKALRDLAAGLGEEDGTPLDWTPVVATPSKTQHVDIASESDESSEPGSGEPNEEYSDSLCEVDPDLYDWDVHGGRDKTLTFSIADAEFLDGQIPVLGEVVNG